MSMRAFIDITEGSPQPSGERLFEMPYLQDTSLDFGLQKPDENLAKAQLLLSRDPSKLFEDNGYVLYRTGSTSGYFFLIDTDDGLINYLIEYEPTSLEGLSGVTQVKLWRSQTLALLDVTQRVFFGYLLKEFGCVISDEAQTTDGKAFWTRVMAIAYRSNREVGFYDNGDITLCTGNYNQWLHQQKAWGDDLSYFKKRFFIKK